ncbi:D-alanyl-D-alanine carboxypeptidase [Methylomarinum sp. Ch1-1]|uniref:D-alanyl-D-alanine carboxypeptidase n=1 Tax=Methylomarinum roseum TaxID=3067653 RepID=A0AAU7NRI8_9GAMM|nr:D-alanyl-D-alanine carboxypeptidase [Methylomarinum sp. Ch1-1]MDP4520400.1 D-alanyl-D-alanine carboxypeptidase [Methylomarinum sp. Ch1-1]
MKPILTWVIALALLTPVSSIAGEALSAFSRLNHAGLVVLDSGGRTVLADHADRPLIPASTTKLATAWMALRQWGEDYRFRTRFYLDDASKTLWVKGSGDPYLVSEELEIIARNLKRKGLKQIETIGLDTSVFAEDLVLPGTGATNNPYDAVPSAVAANFNTVNLKKVSGRVASAEAHTPLTAYAESLADSIGNGVLRVKTGPSPRDAERYFAELLAALLGKQGVEVGSQLQIVFGQVPNRPVFYTHVNSKTLGEIVRTMLKYSTNFIANQLILMLSSETYGRPANTADVQRYMEEKLSRRFAWKNFALADGAGLSHTNRLSPQQLTELLQAFRPWKHLLPEIEPGIYAKSGTLNGVSALAGYFVEHGRWRPFAIVMNEKVPYRLRNRIARELSTKQGANVASFFD